MAELVVSCSSCSLFPWLETQKTPKGKMSREVAPGVGQPVTTRAMTPALVRTRPAGEGRVATAVITRQKRKL